MKTDKSMFQKLFFLFFILPFIAEGYETYEHSTDASRAESGNWLFVLDKSPLDD